MVDLAVDSVEDLEEDSVAELEEDSVADLEEDSAEEDLVVEKVVAAMGVGKTYPFWTPQLQGARVAPQLLI